VRFFVTGLDEEEVIVEGVFFKLFLVAGRGQQEFVYRQFLF
jgi:hypothetical protein